MHKLKSNESRVLPHRLQKKAVLLEFGQKNLVHCWVFHVVQNDAQVDI